MTLDALRDELKDSIRCVPNYPKPGIQFRDITTLLNNSSKFNTLMQFLESRYINYDIDFIAGIESRGFIFGSALATRLGIGFIPIRKKGKLPFTTVSQKYELEYGFDEMEIHIDAFCGKHDAKILLIDDLIATGGTANASIKLIEAIGGTCIEVCFLLNLIEFDAVNKIKARVFTILDI